MDDLTLRFAEESMIRVIKESGDIESLKEAACSLVAAHYAAKRLIAKLLLQSLETQLHQEIATE